MLQRFLPLLTMTFFICLFIVLMQFLWKSIEDLVGKGLSVGVICELFFYAALSMVPTALPLAVLLASLMVFGNLGEKFELTAMKASGISLFRIMRPLIVFMAFLAVGAFFFQNDVLPIAKTKMWTLLFSVRQKSPEVEIPARSFYDHIPNMNLYTESKNPENGMLYGMILYDLSRGYDNTRVILADSGRFNFTEDKTRLFLHLYSGEMFENMRDNSMGASSSRYMPFRREHFDDKQIYFPFDSIGREVDSVGTQYATEIRNAPYFGLTRTITQRQPDGTFENIERPQVALDQPIDIDSIITARGPSLQKSYLTQALAKAKRQKQEYMYRSLALSEQAKLMRRHDIEMQRKFTLSFACIIFFFIGAPLGAIIKKGGLGMPLVISVLLFIVYFLIDNAGYKMARDGKMPVWEGIWLSSFVLLPMGVFFTYKAVGDSAVFNMDAYRNFFRRLIGKTMARDLTLKEVRMTEVEPSVAADMLSHFLESAIATKQNMAALTPLKRLFATSHTALLRQELNNLVDYMSNSSDIYTINLLNQYPFKPTWRNLPVIIETTQNLLKRCGSGVKDITDNER